MESVSPSSLVLRETLLSRKPDPLSPLAMAIATLVVVLLSIAAWTNFFDADVFMKASRANVFGGHQYWRAWTTLFVHGDGKHLLSNSFLFFVLGIFLTGYFGILRVLMSALFFGGITNLIVLASMPKEVHLIGLSGVVFWMGGAWLILYFLLDRKRKVMHRFLRAMGVGLVLFMPAEAFDPSISYKAHFVGFALGIFAGLLFFVINKQTLRKAEVYEAAPFEDDGTAVL